MQKNEWIIESDEGSENLELIKFSKNEAKEYEWLYHCTSECAAKNIIKNRQFWLSSLRRVNDQEEYYRVKKEGYENKFYVLCFSYCNKMNSDNWKEYGNGTQSLQIGIKQAWLDNLDSVNYVVNNQVLTDDNFKILKIRNCLAPFYLESTGTYKIIYDDDLYKRIIEEGKDGFGNVVGFVTPEIGGIIKKKNGLCQRKGEKSYIKNWENEREIRFKVELHNDLENKGVIISDRIAVTLKKPAFEEIKLRFHPEFIDKDSFLDFVYKYIPKEKVYILE